MSALQQAATDQRAGLAAGLLERIQATGKPVTLPPTMRGVLTWQAATGDVVAHGQTLATLDEGGGLEGEITAPVAGKVALLAVRSGGAVEGGAVVAYITPERASAPPATRQNPPKPTSAGRAEPSPEASAPPATCQPSTNPQPTGAGALPLAQRRARRSTMAPSAAPLEVEELHATPAPPPTRPLPAPRPRPQQRRPRVVKRTTRPLDVQGEQFDALAQRLRAAGFDLERSELERTMFALFLALDDAAIVEAAYLNRDREEAGRYGVGANPARAVR